MLEYTNNQKDFLIIGSGIAACTVAHILHQNHLTFKIISNPSLSNSSLIAPGMWNPVVFKRMLKSWKANELIDFLIPFYENIEKKTNSLFLSKRLLIKNFFEQQEIDLWNKKAEDNLSDFLQIPVSNSKDLNYSGSKLTQTIGVVKQAGNINTFKFINASLNYFKNNFEEQTFHHSSLKITNTNIVYKNENYKNVLFCEGHLITENPFFNFIKLKPAKGELLSIKADDLNINNTIINKDGFIFKKNDSEFIVGSTYSWDNLNENTTESAKTELITKLNQLISCNYQITEQLAGIRPSSIDRRPIIGPHPKFKNLFVFNGLGAKGVMLAPFLANNFINYYLKKENLIEDVNVNRFYKFYNV